jgi:hypothetical protein
MVTAKRLYLYGVLGAALVPLLWGLSDLLQLAIRGAAGVVGSRDIIGAELVREDLSLALALVVVALPIWLVHLWLVRRLTSGPSNSAADDERASAARATYFFLVLAATSLVAALRLFDLTGEVLGVVIADDRAWGVAGALAGFIVVGSTWILHLRWRSRDLRSSPDRLAGDWLTRAYLYGTLFVLAGLAAFSAGAVLSVVAQELVATRPAWGSEGWWQDAIVGPLAALVVTSSAWLVHWVMAGRLLNAAEPMGEAHRESRTRTGYFLAVVLLSATAVLIAASMGLRHVFAEILGVWRPSDGLRLIEAIGGPLLMTVPFLCAWWWHLRQASAEALAVGGAALWRSVVRSGRLVVAFVGLAGVTVGLAWELEALLDGLDIGSRGGPLASSTLRDAATPALALALVGLAMWTPAWALSQRERARDAFEVVASTSRRAYLLLVSGLSVVALMGSLAFLVFGATRVLLDAGPMPDTAWPASVLVVAGSVLAYHLFALRSDMRLARRAETPSDGGEAVERATETIQISAPAGADFKVLNAAIRTELPEGYRLRVIAPPPTKAG